jgi:hypothetical protein
VPPRYAVINAVAMFDPRGDDHFFALGHVNEKLCFFDSRPGPETTWAGRANTYCLREKPPGGPLPAEPTALAVDMASAGAVVGTSYYYSCGTCGVHNEGPQYIYAVHDIHEPDGEGSATFSTHADLILKMKFTLWNEDEPDSGANIHDWAPLSERDGEVLVDDGNDGEDYLVGVAPSMRKLVVVKIDKATRQAGSYAVMPLVVDWNDALAATAEQIGLNGEAWWHERGTTTRKGGSVMGAAYAYSGGADGASRAFFSSNPAWGLFELALPVTVRVQIKSSTRLQCARNRMF